MGQRLSTGARPERTISTSKTSHRSKKRDSGVDVAPSFRPVHWDRSSTQRDSTIGTPPHLNGPREVNGNTGTSKRYFKPGKAQSSVKSVRAKDDEQRPQRSTTQKTRTKTKIHQHTISQTSKSNFNHKRNYQTKECTICADVRPLHRFPDRPPTEQCSHDNDACRRCLRTWIQSEFSTKIWNEINCPICSARMKYDDIRAFAPVEVFHRYALQVLKPQIVY